MSHFGSLLNGVGIGLAAMYFFDPARGRYRQSLVRGQLTRCLNDAEHFVGVGWRDLRNRSSGWLAEMSHTGSHATDDHTLEARVRSNLGRIVSHPRALSVEAHDGCIRLSGQILESEAEAAAQCARHIPGVQSVQCEFERRPSSEDFAELVSHRSTAAGTMTPATQLLLAAAATTVVGLTCARRAPLTCLLGTAAMLAFAGESHAMSRQQQLASRGRQGTERPERGSRQDERRSEPKQSSDMPPGGESSSETMTSETISSRFVSQK